MLDYRRANGFPEKTSLFELNFIKHLAISSGSRKTHHLPANVGRFTMHIPCITTAQSGDSAQSAMHHLSSFFFSNLITPGFFQVSLKANLIIWGISWPTEVLWEKVVLSRLSRCPYSKILSFFLVDILALLMPFSPSELFFFWWTC